MRRLILIAAVLSLAACTRGKVLIQDQQAISVAQLAGYTDPVEVRPHFVCASGPTISVLTNSGGGSSYGQQGHFLTAKAPDGSRVRLAICEGQNLPPRLAVIGPDQNGFTPIDGGKR